MSMQKCPVCEGRGNVPVNFYTRSTLGTSANPVECRSCHGRGIVFAPDPVPQSERWEWPRTTVNVSHCDHDMNTVARQAAKVVAEGLTTELRKHRAELLP